MINFRPVLALSLVFIGFLISISVAFLDILGPDIPLPRKSISEVLKAPGNAFTFSTKENTNITAARRSAKMYLNQENLVHEYSNLKFNENLSDPINGNFTFLSALCYGSSKNDCIYFNSYLKSSDFGDTWKIGFLE